MAARLAHTPMMRVLFQRRRAAPSIMLVCVVRVDEGARRGAARICGAPATRRSTCSSGRRHRSRGLSASASKVAASRFPLPPCFGYRHGRQGQPGAPPKRVVACDPQGAAHGGRASPASPATCLSVHVAYTIAPAAYIVFAVIWFNANISFGSDDWDL